MSAAPSTTPSTVQIAQLLLDLHERANELGYREFQRYAFKRMAELVPFDSGLLGAGTIQNGVPHGHDVVLHEQPWALMESWEPLKHEDRIAVFAFMHPGKTGNFDVEGPIFDGADAAREHSRQFGIAHVLCTSGIQKTAGLYAVLSLYRADPANPFTEAERQAIEIVIPHVFAAARQARVAQLRAATHVSDVHGQSAAIVNDDGLVLEADPGLVDLLRVEWPAWTGPHLPPELVAAMRATPSTRIVRERIVVRADAGDGVRLLHVRRAVLADRLTPREREIAGAFSLGETYREIGTRLGIAPNTVRRHLGNIYGKLGISSKVELDRMLADDR
jgi:DNA-binding CsgD family transcriptional regulator